MTNDAPLRPDNPGRAPLDRDQLAAHFDGYDVDALITVALNPVALADRKEGGDLT
jgi:hypothetical protein